MWGGGGVCGVSMRKQTEIGNLEDLPFLFPLCKIFSES